MTAGGYAGTNIYTVHKVLEANGYTSGSHNYVIETTNHIYVYWAIAQCC